MMNEEEYKKEIEKLCEHIVGDKVLLSNQYKKMMDEYFDQAVENFFDYLDNSSPWDIKRWIRDRVHAVIESLLSGDSSYLKDNLIISQYSFGKLQKVRIAIWESAGGEIANSAIAVLQKENDSLREELKYERKRRDY